MKAKFPMCAISLFFLIALFTLIHSTIATSSNKKVAIIGGGIGGSGLTYYLNEMTRSNLDIEIFEKNKQFGGRAFKFNVGENDEVELGAAIIAHENILFRKAAEDFNLTIEPLKRDRSYVIWNGKEVLFRQTGNTVSDSLRLLWRYFLSLFKTKAFINESVNKYYKIYQERAFKSIEDLVELLDIKDEISKSISTTLVSKGIKSEFINEIIAGAIRGTYTQGIEVHSLAGIVSMFNSNYFKIEGGNQKLAESFVTNSQCKQNRNTVVTKIEKDNKGQYKVHYYNAKNDKEKGFKIFDYVIIATPLPISKIDISFLSHETHALVYGVKYHTMCTIIIDGELNENYLGETPELILTSNDSDLPYYSIGKIDTKRPNIYKIFAKTCQKEQKEENSYLDKIFSRYTILHQQLWNAYPVMKPVESFPPVKLDDSMYYINAIEPLLSVMEVELASALNIAKLIVTEMLNAFEPKEHEQRQFENKITNQDHVEEVNKNIPAKAESKKDNNNNNHANIKGTKKDNPEEKNSKNNTKKSGEL